MDFDLNSYIRIILTRYLCIVSIIMVIHSARLERKGFDTEYERVT